VNAQRVDHLPTPDLSRAFDYGRLCARCKVPVDRHRVEHAYVPVPRTDVERYERAGKVFGLHNDHDELCGFYIREQDRLCGLPQAQHLVRKSKKKPQRTYIGIDGEGVGRDPHRYVMLCAADHRIIRKHIPIPKPRRLFIEAEQGLSSEECLRFVLSLPKAARLFMFGFGYDLTKWLADLPDEALYALNNPLLRTPPATEDNPYPKPDPVPWKAPSGEIYYLNLLQTRFTVFVKREHKTEEGKTVRYRRSRIVWDILRFFNTGFAQTIEDWDVGLPKVRRKIAEMKKKRGGREWSWDEREEIRSYCMDECHLLARLAKKNIKVHKEAGIPLKSFFGAGSSAAAMLKKLDVTRTITLDPTRFVRGKPTADRSRFARELSYHIMQGFTGGRFENAVCGAVQGPVYNHDISSAYAYQLTFLPCLEHGGWSLTNDRDRMLAAKHALVHYRLGQAPKDLTWGPFPFREPDGTIVYAKESGGGWVWRAEYLAGERLCKHVDFVEAYVLESECECQPFAEIPRYYNLRLRLGKEGAGLAIKTSLASVYGKLAQNVGMHPFQCWVWAGMTTSGTRAQLLDAIAAHRDPRNVLGLATDGFLSLEHLELGPPRNTGTGKAQRPHAEIAADKANGRPCPRCGTVGCIYAHKPLGGWETKVSRSGVFFAGLGRTWDLDKHGADLAGSLKSIRARGIGRNTLAQHVLEIRQAWAAGHLGITIPGKGPTEEQDHVRFRGMRSSVRRTSHSTYYRVGEYGEWVPTDIKVSFDPLPKRLWPGGTLARSPRSNSGNNDFVRLHLRGARGESLPYLPTSLSPEAIAMKAAAVLQSEQPDPEDLGDFDD
jgi:hypothetical protein